MRASAFISASAGILLVLLLLSAGCGQRPTSGSNTSTGFQPFWDATTVAGGTPVPTTPDLGTVVEVTFETVTITPEPPATIDQVTYVEVYHKEYAFKGNTTGLEYSLNHPPLLIDVTVKPVNITRTTSVRDVTCQPTEYNLCLKSVKVTYPDPNAWFTIKVKPQGSTQVVAEDGFARDYDVGFEKRLTVRSPGNYFIELSGNQVSVDVQMRVAT
ncbi:MAG: hypothetical protein LUO87_02715 [Methanomicrobiales archaeon]|nr:hypothetical protein [Methanomicrobiales archaeon]MDD1656891.1 hypothetical protein [Methanomicrobiales archaeon]